MSTFDSVWHSQLWMHTLLRIQALSQALRPPSMSGPEPTVLLIFLEFLG